MIIERAERERAEAERQDRLKANSEQRAELLKYPRYQFHSERATAYPDGTYVVDARTDRGWDITWYIRRGDDGQWVIYTYKPSHERRYIKPSGSLGKRILARVNRTIADAQAQAPGD